MSNTTALHHDASAVLFFIVCSVCVTFAQACLPACLPTPHTGTGSPLCYVWRWPRGKISQSADINVTTTVTSCGPDQPCPSVSPHAPVDAGASAGVYDCNSSDTHLPSPQGTHTHPQAASSVRKSRLCCSGFRQRARSLRLSRVATVRERHTQPSRAIAALPLVQSRSAQRQEAHIQRRHARSHCAVQRGGGHRFRALVGARVGCDKHRCAAGPAVQQRQQRRPQCHLWQRRCRWPADVGPIRPSRVRATHGHPGS